MKKTNIHYRESMTRQNHYKVRLIKFFISICSFPRLFLEVHLRGQFGKQYFNLGSVFAVIVIMFPLPFLIKAAGMTYSYFTTRTYGFDLGEFLLHYLSWYAILTAFVVRSIQHRLEMRTVAGEFIFTRYSKSSGITHPWIYDLEINGWKPSERQMEILVEPALPFIAGMMLWILSQPIGLIIMCCAIIYSCSYAADYYLGDVYIMNTIDIIIVNREKEAIFVFDKKPEDTAGVRFRGERPSSQEMRTGLYENAIKEDDISEVV